MPPSNRAQLVQLMYVLDELRKFGRNRIFDTGDRKMLRDYLVAVPSGEPGISEWDSIHSQKTDGRQK